MVETRPQGAHEEISRRELFQLASPLGKVTLDSSKCTGCGLCALECTTGALVFSPGDKVDVYQLLFKHGLCIVCDQCVEVCPEQCLHLERTLEPGKLDDKPVVLFEDKVAKCRECGGVIGPMAMVNRLQLKLGAAGNVTSQLELCTACKVKARFSRR
jgi:ferredoxin